MQASQAGRQASLKGSKSVKNKNLFGDKSVIFINKNISVPEGPDVSKSCFQSERVDFCKVSIKILQFPRR